MIQLLHKNCIENLYKRNIFQSFKCIQFLHLILILFFLPKKMAKLQLVILFSALVAVCAGFGLHFKKVPLHGECQTDLECGEFAFCNANGTCACHFGDVPLNETDCGPFVCSSQQKCFDVFGPGTTCNQPGSNGYCVSFKFF